ncbi:MAG: threonine/serine exporter family protein [Akkermansia sp.]
MVPPPTSLRAVIIESSDILLKYGVSLMESGSHTSRVVRNMSRIAETFGYSVAITIFQHTIIMSATDREDHSVRQTLITKINHHALNFETISLLSNLSWEVVDKKLTVSDFKKKYKAILAKPRMSRWLVLFLVACANASFCRLFQGDIWAMGVVFIATLVGFFVRQELLERRMNLMIVFIICAFIASMVGSLAVCFKLGTTPSIALASSVLFLIPGVPLINAVIDILEGYVLMGISRMMNAFTLIICIALGLALTLYILRIETI